MFAHSIKEALGDPSSEVEVIFDLSVSLNPRACPPLNFSSSSSHYLTHARHHRISSTVSLLPGARRPSPAPSARMETPPWAQEGPRCRPRPGPSPRPLRPRPRPQRHSQGRYRGRTRGFGARIGAGSKPGIDLGRPRAKTVRVAETPGGKGRRPPREKISRAAGRRFRNHA